MTPVPWDATGLDLSNAPAALALGRPCAPRALRAETRHPEWHDTGPRLAVRAPFTNCQRMSGDDVSIDEGEITMAMTAAERVRAVRERLIPN